MRTRSLLLGTLLASAATTTFASDTPCEERVAMDCSWSEKYPFNTIARLFVEDEDGRLGGYGTGFVVSPYCALTNGHCLYKRDKGRYFTKDIHLMPGACRNGSGYTNAFGRREALHKRTNTKFADQNYSPVQAVDYGALQFVCPFPELTTFMPLCFNYASDWAHMSGYATESTPDSSEDRNQWVAYGDVTDTRDRWMEYDAKSTGGASGSPVWNWQANDNLVEVFAINRGHTSSCNGIGTRLVEQNYDLIRSWMQWEPSLSEKFNAGCAELTVVPFGHLMEWFSVNPERLLAREILRIEDPIAPPPTGPSRRVMQVIENGFYEWVEFDLQPGNPNSNRLVQLLKAPGRDLAGKAWNPGDVFVRGGDGWLEDETAQVLLSASAGKAAREDVIGIEATNLVAEAIQIEIPENDPGDTEQDGPDFELPEAAACLGDLDGDASVNGSDLGLLLSGWNTHAHDLNRDGITDGGDIGMILSLWGPCPGE